MCKNFNNITKIAATGDLLLFYNSKNILSKKIGKFYTLDIDKKVCYSHVAIYLGSGQGLIFESAFPHGTEIVPINKYFKDNYTITVKRLKNVTVNDIAKLKDIVYQEIALKQGYDWFSFLGFLTAKLFKTSVVKDNKFGSNSEEFCSSITDDLWKKVGYDFFPNIGDKRVTPNDWANLEQFETICSI